MQAHKEFVPSRLVNVPFMTILRERAYKETSVENLPFRSNFIYYVDQVLYAIEDLPDDKRPLKFNLKTNRQSETESLQNNQFQITPKKKKELRPLFNI